MRGGVFKAVGDSAEQPSPMLERCPRRWKVVMRESDLNNRDG